MKAMQFICAITFILIASASAQTQDIPKPGPEHEILKKMEGSWDAVLKFGGMESKGTMTYKMEVGGLWLVSSFDGEFAGMKFQGKGLDSYDAGKKKYIGIWVDSMSTTPMTLEGTYDKEKKVFTMAGEGPGIDGKQTKYKSVTELLDETSMKFSMYMGDGKDPAFTIAYKKKK